jgi:alanine racemase
MKTDKYKTWIEISSVGIRNNIKNTRECIGENILLMAIVKGNAYGLDIEKMTYITKEIVDWYGVDNIEEANIVRKNSNKPILILNYTTADKLAEIVKKKYSIVAYDYNTVKLLSKLSTENRKAKIHIKIDTGLARLGLTLEELPNFIKSIKKLPNIKIEGLYTHYARLMNENGCDIYQYQLNKFHEAEKKLQELNINVDIKHTASSMAAILYEKTRLDMVRIGTLFYGLWGTRDAASLVKRKGHNIKLYPVLSFKTRIVNIKELKRGMSAGYMSSWTAKKNTKLAIIGAGYYDGIDRRYAEKGCVLIKGQFAKIVGKIAMNTFMVDASKIKNIKIGETVVIIGRSRKNEITAYNIAESMGTSTYEITTRINPLIPRIIV